MKKLSDDEFNELSKRGRGPGGIVYNQIFNMQVGENLQIEKKDWHRKDSPGRLCRYIEKKHPGVKYKFHPLAHDLGWVVKRME